MHSVEEPLELTRVGDVRAFDRVGPPADRAVVVVHRRNGQRIAESFGDTREEAPLIDAELELLDVQIALLDRPASVLGARRLRRAANKVLAVRREVANRVAAGEAA